MTVNKEESMRRSQFQLVTILVLAVFGLGSGVSAEIWFDAKETHTFEEPIEFELDLIAGRVVITTSPDNVLTIESAKRIMGKNWEEAKVVADHIDVDVAVTGHRVSVNTRYLDLNKRGKSFWEKLFGTGDNYWGDVEYRIALPAATRVKITANQAEIELSSIESQIEIENGSGAVKGEFLAGPITIRQDRGEIDLDWVEGDIRVESMSGRIGIRQTRGAIDLATESGDVTIETTLNSPRDYHVETTSGEIRFLVPESVLGLISIEMESGDQNRVLGDYRAGGNRVTLTSISGKMTLAGH